MQKAIVRFNKSKIQWHSLFEEDQDFTSVTTVTEAQILPQVAKNIKRSVSVDMEAKSGNELISIYPSPQVALREKIPHKWGKTISTNSKLSSAKFFVSSTTTAQIIHGILKVIMFKLPEVAMLSLVGIELTNICLHPQVDAK